MFYGTVFERIPFVKAASVDAICFSLSSPNNRPSTIIIRYHLPITNLPNTDQYTRILHCISVDNVNSFIHRTQRRSSTFYQPPTLLQSHYDTSLFVQKATNTKHKISNHDRSSFLLIILHGIIYNCDGRGIHPSCLQVIANVSFFWITSFGITFLVDNN